MRVDRHWTMNRMGLRGGPNGAGGGPNGVDDDVCSGHSADLILGKIADARAAFC